MDIAFIATAGATALYNSGVPQGIAANRADRGIDAFLGWLSRRRSVGDVSFDVDLAYAAWWPCLQAGISICSECLEGEGGDERREISALRKHLRAEVRALGRNRKRYFERRLVTPEDDADLDIARSRLRDPNALLRYFREWMECGLADGVEAPSGLEPLFAPGSFGSRFDAYLGEVLKRDRGARVAYESVVLRAVQELSQGDKRRREADQMATASVGRNARLLVERRIDDLVRRPLVGREQALAEIRRLLSENDSASILLAAPPGYGKSSLLAHWLRSEGARWGDVAYHFVSLDRGPQVNTRARVFGNLLGQMLPHYGLELDLSRDPESQVGTLLDGETPVGADGERLVILIDGLDEVTDWDGMGPTLLLEGGLSPGVFLIASVRSDPDSGWDLAPNWEHDVELRLEPLSADAIAEALATQGESELLPWADDKELVAQIEEATGGIPLYLDFALRVLADEARNGRSPGEALATSAAGSGGSGRAFAEDRFAAFLRGHLRHLHAAFHDLSDRAEYRLLHLLVASGTPLHEEDLQKLGVDPLSLTDGRVMRWILGPESGDYSLPHPFLRGALAGAFGPTEVERHRRELRSLADSWPETPSHFAARQLPGLLAEEARAGGDGAEKSRRALLALAEDRRFLDLQATLLREEPHLPGDTLASAAEVALEFGETRAAVDLALARIDIGRELELPLHALRGNAPLARLVALVSGLRGDAQLSWCVLIDLALGIDRPDEQRAFRAWHTKLLPPGSPVAHEAAGGHEVDQALVVVAGRIGEYALAERLADRIHDDRYRAAALADVAGQLSEADREEDACRVAARAREVAAGNSAKDLASAWLVRISRRFSQAGLDADARAAAAKACELADVNGPDGSTYGIAEAARRASEIGESAIALATARRASKLASGSLFEIAYAARALAFAGDSEAVIEVVRQALPDASPEDWEGRRFAAEALAAAGDSTGAEEVAAEALARAMANDGLDWRLTALLSVAKTLHTLGDEQRLHEAWREAETVALACAGDGDKARALRKLAKNMAATGDRNRARGAMEKALALEGKEPQPGGRESPPPSPGVAAMGALESIGRTLEAKVAKTRSYRTSTTLVTATEVLSAARYSEEAIAVARAIENNGHRGRALAIAALAHPTGGDAAAAAALAQEAFAVATEASSDRLPYEARRVVPRALAGALRPERVLELLRSLEVGERCEPLAAAAGVLAERGEPAAALEAARKAVEAAEALVVRQDEDRQLPWMGLDRRACHAFAVGATAEATHGSPGRSVELARRVWGAEVDNLGEHIEMAEWAGNALAAGAVSEGIDAVLSMSRDVRQPEAIAAALLSCAEALLELNRSSLAGRAIELAQERVQPLGANPSRVRILAKSAPLLLAVGNPAGARSVAEEAQRLAPAPENDPTEGMIPCYIAKALLATGNVEGATAFALEALKLAEASSRYGWPVKIVTEVGPVLVQTDQADLALEAARSLEESQERSDALAAIARSLAAKDENASSFHLGYEILISLA